MLRAVVFDWGGTLAEWNWSDELLAAGHAAGLRALGREPDALLTARFRAEFLPRVEGGDYRELVREWLGDVDVDRFVEAEHAAWAPAFRLASTTHALLETLRGRGLALGVVSNAFDPPELLHADLERLGVGPRVDVAVFASEVGSQKPEPAIYRRALGALGVRAEDALYVGDAVTDLAGAAALGMRTCQALWFEVDGDTAFEPDFQAFTQTDVVVAVDRLVSVS